MKVGYIKVKYVKTCYFDRNSVEKYIDLTSWGLIGIIVGWQEKVNGYKKRY